MIYSGGNILTDSAERVAAAETTPAANLEHSIAIAKSIVPRLRDALMMANASGYKELAELLVSALEEATRVIKAVEDGDNVDCIDDRTVA